MLKKLICLIVLIPSLVLAQSTGDFIRNDGASTPIQSNNLKPSKGSTDQYGNQFVIVQTPIPINASTPIPISGGPFEVYPEPAPTAVVTRVPDQATSVSCLAANPDRRGAEFVNDSTEISYVKKGATASATDFTVRLMPQDYYYQEDGYVGEYSCIWANNASGGMQVTEVTP